MGMGYNVRAMARTAMMARGYDPLEELIVCAQSTDDPGVKRDIAEVLLPYMYPKLANVQVEMPQEQNDAGTARHELMMKILKNPELADAAQRLSLAAADVAIEREFPPTIDVGQVQ